MGSEDAPISVFAHRSAPTPGPAGLVVFVTEQEGIHVGLAVTEPQRQRKRAGGPSEKVGLLLPHTGQG